MKTISFFRIVSDYNLNLMLTLATQLTLHKLLKIYVLVERLLLR